MKICSKCKVIKDYFLFSKDKYNKDGYTVNCKDCRNAYKKLNKKQILASNKRYYKQNKTKILELSKQYYYKNQARIQEKHRNYRINNKQYFATYQNKYNKKRKKIDPLYKLLYNLRIRLNKSLKYGKKRNHTIYYIDCSLEFLSQHLQKQFQPGMTWENYGQWHIDHIIPLCSAKNKKQLLKLWHYSNLQPLWAIDNLKKGSKLL